MKQVLVLVGVSMLRLCGSHADAPVTATPGATNPPGAMGAPGTAMAPGGGMAAPGGGMAAPGGAMAAPATPPPAPAHGGFVAMMGPVAGEVATLPDGHLAVFTSDAAHAPVHASAIQVNIVNSDGSLVPVAMNFDPAQNAYLGAPEGITAGTYAVQVWMVQNENGPVAQMSTTPMAISPMVARAGREGGFNIPLGGGHGVHVGGRGGLRAH